MREPGRGCWFLERNAEFAGAATNYQHGPLTVEASLHETADPSDRLDPKTRILRALGILDELEFVPVGAFYELAVRHLVAGELVGDDHPGQVAQALAQSAEELLCGHRVLARPDHNVEHGGVLVDRAPQVPLCAVIWTNTSSRCQLSPSRRPRRRSWLAYSGPNRSHQARIVS